MSGQVQSRNDALVELLRSEFPRSPWGCAFSAYANADQDNFTGDGTGGAVAFNTEIFDMGNDFATPNFTAPADGAYFLSSAIRYHELAAAHTTVLIRLITSNRQYWVYQHPHYTGNLQGQMQISALCDMDAGDTAYIDLIIYNGLKTVDLSGVATNPYTWFCGWRVV